MTHPAQPLVEAAFADRSLLQNKANAQAVLDTIEALDKGQLRVATPPETLDGEWTTHAWIKQAVLLYFGLRQMEKIEVGPFEFYDKIPLKRDLDKANVRVVPPGTARYGSFLEPSAILMPGYVNIGAYVGAGSMVDTWATVGSCAQIGRDVHLAGGVGIGGVLEPPGATPVIIEDGAFIGSRCVVVDGVRVGREAVLGANTVLTKSMPIIDVTGPEPKELRGHVPARSVVVPGTRMKRFPAGEYGLPCALIIGKRTESTDRKVSLNAALRDFGSVCVSGSVPKMTLTDTLLEITRIDSYIGDERALCDHVEARLARTLPASAITRFHDSLVVRANERPGAPRIGLVGHLDVVRTVHDAPARIEGDRLYGPGAADMKSGLAVMIELIERLDLSTLPCDLTLVFYEREEGPFLENRLGPMLDEFQILRELDLAICLEPSNNQLQLGCMGSLHASVRFRGRTSHSARPWQGENAVYKALPFLQLLAAREPHDVDLDGHRFREVLSPTIAATTGRGRNVIPDEYDINVNYRFAPPRKPEEAFAELTALVGGAAQVELVDAAPAGRPHAQHPLVQKLAAAGVASVQTKQAWTDVARFDALGVPAVNFGPGTQNQAHQRNEYTELPLLEEGFGILWRFLHSL